jgi:hypothetical protein
VQLQVFRTSLRVRALIQLPFAGLITRLPPLRTLSTGATDELSGKLRLGRTFRDCGFVGPILQMAPQGVIFIQSLSYKGYQKGSVNFSGQQKNT